MPPRKPPLPLTRSQAADRLFADADIVVDTTGKVLKDRYGKLKRVLVIDADSDLPFAESVQRIEGSLMLQRIFLSLRKLYTENLLDDDDDEPEDEEILDWFIARIEEIRSERCR
jgi:hypothetical protein